MKKKYIFLIVIVLILIIITVDLFIPRGKKMPNIDYEDYDKLLNTYSITESENKIILTMYNTSPLKSKIIYEYQDKDIINVVYKREYLNKFEALWYYFEDGYDKKYNAELKNNIIVYYSDESSLGNTTMIDVQELLNNIKENEENNIILEQK